MYDAIQNPPKGRKEKDVGKRRAYVRVVTSLGGSLNLELYCEKVKSPVILERPTLLTHGLGAENMLQLVDACKAREVQRRCLPPANT